MIGLIDFSLRVCCSGGRQRLGWSCLHQFDNIGFLRITRTGRFSPVFHNPADHINIQRLGNNLIEMFTILRMFEQTFHITGNGHKQWPRKAFAFRQKLRSNLQAIHFGQMKIEQGHIITAAP